MFIKAKYIKKLNHQKKKKLYFIFLRKTFTITLQGLAKFKKIIYMIIPLYTTILSIFLFI